MVTIYNYLQGSPEWFQCKLGIPSAGSFSKVLAKGQGKTRKSYMLKLAAEILIGEHRETYQNAEMERGIIQEEAARVEYEFITGRVVDQIGFAMAGKVGCSPDGLCGHEGGIEIKSVIPEIQIETILSNKIPSSHIAQIQGNMMVLDCQWWDFVSYSPLIKNKNYIFIKRAYPDAQYFKKLQTELLSFLNDLNKMVNAMGGKY